MWVIVHIWAYLIYACAVHGTRVRRTSEQLHAIVHDAWQNPLKVLWSNGGRAAPNDGIVLASLLLSLSPAGGFQGSVHHDILRVQTRLSRRAPFMTEKPNAVEAVKDLVEDDDWHTSAFKKETVAALAAEVHKYVFVPGIPPGMVNWLLMQIVGAMSNKMSSDTQVELRTMLSEGFTTGSNIKATREKIKVLAEKISDEIAPEIKVPVLSEETEKAVIGRIVNMLLTRRLLSSGQRRKEQVKFLIQGGKTVLDEKGREQLVAELNEKVDIPFLNEAAEQKLLMGVVDSIAKMIEEIVPPSLLQCMDGHEDAQGYDEMKAKMIERLDKADHGLVPKEAKTWVVTKVVDALLQSTIGNTKAEMALLSPEERIAKLEDRRDLCEQNLNVNELRHQQEQDNLRQRIAKIDERLKIERENTS